MIPIYKGIAVFMFGILPPGLLLAQTPIVMEDYTSGIATSSDGSTTTFFQIGGPLSVPDEQSGNVETFQDLFAILSGVSGAQSGIADVYDDDASVKLTFDPATRVIKVNTGERTGSHHLLIADTEGKLWGNFTLSEPSQECNLPNLPAGRFIAALLSSENCIKHLKFIIE